MIDERQVFERVMRGFVPPDDSLERLVRRRDRKRRNQRITAGVVGIAVFVAAVWIVTSGLSLDRSTPAVPGLEAGPMQTAPPRAPTSAAPDVVRQGRCRFVRPGEDQPGEARSRLELTFTETGDRIKVRFEVWRSPPGHRWHITFEHTRGPLGLGREFFRGSRVANDSGFLVAQQSVRNRAGLRLITAEARDWQTRQVCRAGANL